MIINLWDSFNYTDEWIIILGSYSVNNEKVQEYLLKVLYYLH